MSIILLSIGLVAWIAGMLVDRYRMRQGYQPSWSDLRVGNWIVFAMLLLNLIAEILA